MRDEQLVVFLLLFLLLAFVIILSIIFIVSLWKIYIKAGKPGWAAIVPIYNTVVLFEITGKPIWWIVFLFIPYVNGIASIVIYIIIYLELSKRFGKSTGFALGLFFLPLIFLPILAFGPAKYQSEDMTNVDHLIS